jgi:hypothetical protein
MKFLMCFMLGTLLFTGCDNKKNNSVTKPPIKLEINKKYYFQDKNMTVYFLTIKNHQYIKTVVNPGVSYSWGGLTHDPECTTCTKQKEK